MIRVLRSRRPLKKSRGIIVRRLAGYGLPYALRVTIGTEEEMKSVDTGLWSFQLEQCPHYSTKLTFIGIGLIGSSIVVGNKKTNSETPVAVAKVKKQLIQY